MLWKLLAGAGVLALAIFIVGHAMNAALAARELAGMMKERAAWEHARADSEKAKAAKERADQQRVTDAVEQWAAAKDALEPVILRSKEKVIEYAQTDAGRVMCLGRDRVQSIEADAAALGLDTTTAAAVATMQADDAAR